MPVIPDFRVTQILGYFVIDPRDNSEGLLSILTGEGHMPMVAAAADAAKEKMMDEQARSLSQNYGLTIYKSRFLTRENVATFYPLEVV